jgi:hypothetical protein
MCLLLVNVPVRWRAPSFFARDPVPVEETADRALAKHQAFLGQAPAQFLDREVRCPLQHGQDCLLVRLDAA